MYMFHTHGMCIKLRLCNAKRITVQKYKSNLFKKYEIKVKRQKDHDKRSDSVLGLTRSTELTMKH